jgi:glycosyltransferase involved in cell wall biosynthesis
MDDTLPFFSIVIPTYARQRQLEVCLRAVADLDYPQSRFEVIVVDDGSESSQEATVASLADLLDVTYVRQAHCGPATARNAGARRATGELLAFTDDDCRPARDWLRILASRSAQMPGHAIGGRTLNALPRNLYSTASQSLVSYLYAYYNADPARPAFFASNNLLLPANRFHAIGGFDTIYTCSAAEDRELCDRWLQHGYRMVYAPEAVVHHAHPLSLRTFLCQHFDYGRGAFRFREARVRRIRGRLRVEPLSFYLRLLAYPYTVAREGRPWALAALLLISQTANAIGFLCEGARRIAERLGQ